MLKIVLDYASFIAQTLLFTMIISWFETIKIKSQVYDKLLKIYLSSLIS